MLIGVSLGPGEPDLLTLKSKKILETCDEVFVSGKRSKELVKNYCEPNELEFPMTNDEEVLKDFWDKNTDIIAKEAKKKDVAFANIGDINFFSTFGHIKRRMEKKYPDVEIKTIPGVPSFTAAFSKLEEVLNKPITITDDLNNQNDVKLILKANKPTELSNKLEKKGYSDFSLLKELFTDKEEITNQLPSESPYFSILVAKKEGENNDS